MESDALHATELYIKLQEVRMKQEALEVLKNVETQMVSRHYTGFLNT